MACGKKEVPRSVLFVAAERLAIMSGLTIDPMGLYPRKAANSADVGGISETWAAVAAGTPASTRLLANTGGSLLESPIIRIVKYSAMLRAMPVF